MFAFTSEEPWIQEGEDGRLAAELNCLFQKLSLFLAFIFGPSSSETSHRFFSALACTHTHTETAEKDREVCDFVVWLGDCIKTA